MADMDPTLTLQRPRYGAHFKRAKPDAEEETASASTPPGIAGDATPIKKPRRRGHRRSSKDRHSADASPQFVSPQKKLPASVAVKKPRGRARNLSSLLNNEPTTTSAVTAVAANSGIAVKKQAQFPSERQRRRRQTPLSDQLRVHCKAPSDKGPDTTFLELRFATQCECVGIQVLSAWTLLDVVAYCAEMQLLLQHGESNDDDSVGVDPTTCFFTRTGVEEHRLPRDVSIGPCKAIQRAIQAGPLTVHLGNKRDGGSPLPSTFPTVEFQSQQRQSQKQQKRHRVSVNVEKKAATIITLV